MGFIVIYWRGKWGVRYMYKPGEPIHFQCTPLLHVLSSLMEISYKDYKSYKDIYEITVQIRICQIM